MKTIGMLGGMSWESTLPYYRWANEIVRERLGGLHSARIVLHSVDFQDIEQLQREARWDEAGRDLAAAARGLERAGADCLVLCTNTMHKVAPAIEAAIGIPLLHIADATAAAVDRAGLRTVGLLATRFTMEEGFYLDRLRERHGLEMLVPELNERDEVHRVIYEELCLGRVLAASRRTYRRVIDRLLRRGAQGIILGCTEISLLVAPADVPAPAFDSTRLHVEAAVAFALGDPRRGAGRPPSPDS